MKQQVLVWTDFTYYGDDDEVLWARMSVQAKVETYSKFAQIHESNFRVSSNHGDSFKSKSLTIYCKFKNEMNIFYRYCEIRFTFENVLMTSDLEYRQD